MSRFKKVLIYIIVIGLIVLLAFNLISALLDRNYNARNSFLDVHETTKMWVIEDVRNYLKIKDEESWRTARADSLMTDSLRSELYGSTYNGVRYGKYSSISFEDAQYTLDEEDKIIVYLSVDIMQEGVERNINVLVYVKDNLIYDIIGF